MAVYFSEEQYQNAIRGGAPLVKIIEKQKNPLRQLRSYQSRANGEAFENLIKGACKEYVKQGMANIEKTPEPFKITRDLGNGQFQGHFEKMAQPDFKGTLRGGQAIAFEAKHTDNDQIEYARLTEEQIKQMELHYQMGAECFVLVSYRFSRFFRVPWEVWRAMKKLYGRKYMKREELLPYRVPMKNGVIKFIIDGGKENV